MSNFKTVNGKEVPVWETWTTKEGKVLLISEMETRHLQACVSFLDKIGRVLQRYEHQILLAASSIVSAEFASYAIEQDLMRCWEKEPEDYLEDFGPVSMLQYQCLKHELDQRDVDTDLLEEARQDFKPVSAKGGTRLSNG